MHWDISLCKCRQLAANQGGDFSDAAVVSFCYPHSNIPLALRLAMGICCIGVCRIGETLFRC
jgi:hypothetical protein